MALNTHNNEPKTLIESEITCKTKIKCQATKRIKMCTIDLLHKNLTRVYICTQDFNKLRTTKL